MSRLQFAYLPVFFMQLSILLKDILPISPEIDRPINQLVLDSRKIQAGDVFIALQGAQQDGKRYVDEVIAKGAAGVLIEAATGQEEITINKQVPVIPVKHLRSLLGYIAGLYYGFPAKQLHIFGVTGTNGKTSCTHFIAQSLQALGTPAGVIGTLGSGMVGAVSHAGLTTPDAITLHATLAALSKQGAKAVAMEVSSHSIDQQRINGIEFEVGVFTNLTQDHLDYHGNMERYAAVKHRFLADMPVNHLVINADDAYGCRWLPQLAEQRSVFAYSLQPDITLPPHIPLTTASAISLTLAGIQADIDSPWGHGRLFSPLIGRFNLSNSLAVLNSLCIYGVPFKQALDLLANLKPVDGRMQTLGGEGKPLAVVDYAHTPDALENALKALKVHTKGKLLCVFGCGGDRDASKRPMMAKIAEQWADKVIVTNDNPRSEDPEAIAQQIFQGFSNPNGVIKELDRSKAIEKSIQLASVDDCILIAGKGAERYQQIGNQQYPFDDVKEVQTYLQRRD